MVGIFGMARGVGTRLDGLVKAWLGPLRGGDGVGNDGGGGQEYGKNPNCGGKHKGRGEGGGICKGGKKGKIDGGG